MAALTKRWLVMACVAALVSCAHKAGGATPAKSEAKSEAKAEQAKADDSQDFQTFKIKGPKKRIGVVDFEDATGHGRNLAVVARDAITEGLVKSGAFVVIEREQLAQVLREQGLGMTGAMSSQSAAKASKLLGLQALITGKITDYTEDVKRGGFGGYYSKSTRTAVARVSVRVTDATTGEIWLAESGEGKADSESTTVMGGGNTNYENTLGKKAFYQAIRQLMSKIVAKADSKAWTGAVVKVAADKVYIGAGSDTNIPVGATLKVRKLGEEIKDPSTGQVLGRELGKNLGSIQVANHLSEKLTQCVVIKGSGFSIGDEVSLDEAAATP